MLMRKSCSIRIKENPASLVNRQNEDICTLLYSISVLSKSSKVVETLSPFKNTRRNESNLRVKSLDLWIQNKISFTATPWMGSNTIKSGVWENSNVTWISFAFQEYPPLLEIRFKFSFFTSKTVVTRRSRFCQHLGYINLFISFFLPTFSSFLFRILIRTLLPFYLSSNPKWHTQV